MKLWPMDPPPRTGDARSRRAAGVAAHEQNPLASAGPISRPMNQNAAQPPAERQRWWLPPGAQAAPRTTGPVQPGPAAEMTPPAGAALPLMQGRELARPVISLGRFARATGLSLKLRFLLALTLLSLAPAFLLVLLYEQSNRATLTQAGQQGLFATRNVPLIFLSIIVVTTLVATWVALPIVRPIRRATREILATTDDVRLLSEQAKKIAKDQRLGTDILEGAAKGLDMRRRSIGRDATLISSSLSSAAVRLTQLAHVISELPDTAQGPLQLLVREVYQELQTSHQLANGIASGLESDPVHKRLGNVMEGAAEISQQFDQASQQLQQGARRLERAAEALQ